jgi:two-component system KDP operon response regulator KdpE
MKKERVLIVEANPQLQRLLRTQLMARDYDVQVTDRGEDAILATAEFEPDLILMDRALPGIDGVETCQRLREWTRIPIIILNGYEKEPDRADAQDLSTVEALDTGADDCVTKPFRIAELLARMRAVQRRAGDWRLVTTPSVAMNFGDMNIDPVNRHVCLNGQPLHLTPTEYRLLHMLASYVGRVLTHRELLTHVWGSESVNDTQYLHVFIGQLRRKLECHPDAVRHILTEPGVGYWFVAKQETL